MCSRFPLCPLTVRQRWEPKVITAVKCTLPWQPSLWQLEKQPPRHGGSYCAAKTTNTGWLREEGEVQRENIQRIGKSFLSTVCCVTDPDCVQRWRQQHDNKTLFSPNNLAVIVRLIVPIRIITSLVTVVLVNLNKQTIKQSEMVHIIPIIPLEVDREINPSTYPSVHPSNPETPTLGRHTFASGKV